MVYSSKNQKTKYYYQPVIVLTEEQYKSHPDSKELMDIFVEWTSFISRALWDDSVYHVEYMNYIGNYILQDVTMIEFELPKSLKPAQVKEKWSTNFENFVDELLKRYGN